MRDFGDHAPNVIVVFVKHRIAHNFVHVFFLCLTGLFSNHGPLYFVNTKMSFSKLGLACHIAKIHSEVILVYFVLNSIAVY